MPTGFVRDEAKGGKSGGVAPLRRPAAHVPCSFTARSASSKKGVEECSRQEVYEKAPTPARGGKKCCNASQHTFTTAPCIGDLPVTAKPSRMLAGKIAIGLFGDEVPAGASRLLSLGVG
uniref:Uncharacterized protein n=1 Tax=Oryza nivara TaxID=4536 RepID=A0A0E0HDA2_ORYNI